MHAGTTCRKKRAWARLLIIAGIGFGIPGCQLTIPLPGSGADEPFGSGGGDGGGSADQLPVVSLRSSNPTPQINETVQLQCSVTSGADGTVRYAFQPDFGRLSVDENAGTATFAISESDVAVTFRFTCTAQVGDRTSNPSNEVLITPTAPP